MSKQLEIVPPDAQNTVPAAVGTDTMSMIERLARDPQFDADKLEKLLAMKERQDKEEARKAFFKALQDFQAICPPLVRTKAGIVTRGGAIVNHYLPLDQMISLVHPFMRRCGLSHRFETLVEKKLVRCYAMHELGHSEFSEFPFESIPNTVTNKAQEFGSGQLYAQRYAFKAVFGLAEAGTDTDGVDTNRALTDEQRSLLCDLRDNLADDRRAAFDEWLKKSGCASIEDLPVARYDEVARMLRKAGGQR